MRPQAWHRPQPASRMLEFLFNIVAIVLLVRFILAVLGATQAEPYIDSPEDW